MKWLVDKDGQHITYDASTLVQLLLGRIMEAKDNRAVDQLSIKLVDSLAKSGGLASTSPYGIVHMAIMLGYYYRVFLERNKITIEEINESPDVCKGPSDES